MTGSGIAERALARRWLTIRFLARAFATHRHQRRWTVVGQDAVGGALTGQFRSMLGEAGSQAVEAMLKGAPSRSSGRLAAGVGLVLLLVRRGCGGPIKDALNTIWK